MNASLGGWFSGFLGVLIFSGSLPATRVAVGSFEPTFLTLARASIAGLLAAAILFVLRQRRPARQDIPALLELHRLGRLQLDELITTRYSLDQINEGFADMRAGRNIRGVVVY